MADESNTQAPAIAPAAADPAPRPRHRYEKHLADYVPIFGTPIRSIKRWIAQGRAAGDVPPLDDPPAMAAWWGRVHPKYRTPDKLLQFVKAEKEAPARVDLSIDGEMGDDEPLRQARANLRAAYTELTAARGGKDGKVDESAVARAHRVWKEAAETFQAAQRGSDDTAKKRGELVAKSEILTAAADLAQQLRRIHETIGRNVDNRLADLPEDTRARIRAAIDAELGTVHALIRRLEQSLTDEFELAAI